MSNPRLYTVTDHATPDRPFHGVTAEELATEGDTEIVSLQCGDSLTLTAFDGIAQTVTITRIH